MKIIAPLLVAAAALGGCTVVPVARPVVYGPPPVAVYPAAPPPVVVVPARPYYGGYGYYGRRHGYWR